MLRHEKGHAVWFSSSVLDACGKPRVLPSFPQDVYNSVEKAISVCGKPWEQHRENSTNPDKKKIVHGFSTKYGGISTRLHLSDLNFGFSVGEARETTLSNYRCFSHALHINPASMLCANQTHTARVLTVDRSFCGMGLTRSYQEVLTGASADHRISDSEGMKAFDGTKGFDGLVTRDTDTALVIRVADCVPILFCDPLHGVIGACHAGWRGTVGGIAANTVSAMCALGAQTDCIRAAIGHAVGLCCYEVDDGFYRTFHEMCGSAICSKIFHKSDAYPNPDRWHCDLSACNRLLLLQCGLLPEHIDVGTLCTCCHPELFHSHRYAVQHHGGVRGLMAACIVQY